jgi:hypothetical protein
MLEALINWWRGYSDADMENVKARLSESESEGIYVTGPERLALRDLCALLDAENRKDGGNLPQT